jgi:hypothetical protein
MAVNGRLYLASEEEDVIVVKMSPSYEMLATNTLANQSFIATPVVASADLYLRRRTHLFRITKQARHRRPRVLSISS